MVAPAESAQGWGGPGFRTDADAYDRAALMIRAGLYPPPPGAPERWEIFTHGGRKPTGIDAVEFAGRNRLELEWPDFHTVDLALAVRPPERKQRHAKPARVGAGAAKDRVAISGPCPPSTR